MNLFPAWIRQYPKSYLKPDIMAGLTIGVMLIPQGMAYALLAGMPPVYGLYAATIPMIVYALLGSSRQLSVGPVAIDSMLTAASISALALSGSQQYISLAIILAFLVGFLQFTVGTLKLGFLIKFLSHPIIVGFTSAAAIVVGTSQLKHLLGIEMPSSPYLHEVITSLIFQLSETHWLTLGIAVGGIAGLTFLKKYLPVYPGPLIMMILATALVALFHLDTRGVDIIGEIPSGLPVPEVPHFDFNTFKQLLPSAFAIALIGSMESLAIGRSLQVKYKKQKVDTDRELLSLGLANMLGSVFKSFPVSGGFSRTAVNDQAGAKTGMSSIVSALIVIATLVFLTPLLYYLPNAILASIILVAVVRLIHIKEAKYLWRVDRKDFLMMIATFIGTLFFGIGTGIGIGVVLSLAWILFEASYPNIVELGRIPGTHIFRNIKRFQGLDIWEDILIIRFDAPLFFVNVDRLRETLLQLVKLRKRKLKAIILDMESINSIDTSALNVLSDTIEEIRNKKILVLFAETKGEVRDRFYLSGFTAKAGKESLFNSIDDALRYLESKNIGIQTENVLND